MIEFTILGEPASKANSRMLVKFGDRPASIKSAKARDYERTAFPQIPAHARQMLEGPVRVDITIYYASERPDLDESVVLDIMQAQYAKRKDGGELIRKGVYKNDRQVREKHIYHRIDKQNPRSEIRVEAMEPQQVSINTEIKLPTPPEIMEDPF